MNVIGGTTDVTTYFVLRTAADGVALTGATIANIDLVYTRTGADHAAKVDAVELAAIDGAHEDNKAKEVDATAAPGLYRVDWPDAAFAADVRQVILTVKYATAFTEHMAVEIDTPVGAAASVTGAVGSVTGAVGSVTGAVGSVTGACGSVTGAVGSVAGNVDGSVASVVGAVGSVTGAVGSVTGAVGSVTGAVGSVAGNVDGSVASVVGAVGSVTGAVGSVTGAVGSVAGNVDGSVASVVGAVGSVTGAVGSVTGAVGSVGAGGIVAATFAAGAIDAAAIAANAIGASELATDAVAEIIAAVWASTDWDSTATMTFGDGFETLWAKEVGNIARTGDVYVHDSPDDDTTAITFTVASGSRTRS